MQPLTDQYQVVWQPDDTRCRQAGHREETGPCTPNRPSKAARKGAVSQGRYHQVRCHARYRAKHETRWARRPGPSPKPQQTWPGAAPDHPDRRESTAPAAWNSGARKCIRRQQRTGKPDYRGWRWRAPQSDMQRHHRTLTEADQSQRFTVQVMAGKFIIDETVQQRHHFIRCICHGRKTIKHPRRITAHPRRIVQVDREPLPSVGDMSHGDGPSGATNAASGSARCRYGASAIRSLPSAPYRGQAPPASPEARHLPPAPAVRPVVTPCTQASSLTSSTDTGSARPRVTP